MTPAQLHRAVARATGDDVATIAHLGFHIVAEDDPSEDDVPGQIVDWDDHQTTALLSVRSGPTLFHRRPLCPLVRN